MATIDEIGGIAIVGMAVRFPGAVDLDAFWSNLRDGTDAIGEVPPSRWDPSLYDPEGPASTRFYCRRGGFLDDLALAPDELELMPSAVSATEPDQILALLVARHAVADAGAAVARADPERVGVVLGRGGYLTPGMARLDQHVRGAEQLARSLAVLVPELGADRIARVREAFRAQLGFEGGGNAIGLVPNLAASRIAHRLDLHGPAYTLDAACASSLLAVDRACAELERGRCDLMLAGGVHVCHDPSFWSVFSQLGALSRTQSIRPFDRRADGLLIGEGVGIVVLERLADALRHDRRIYAIVRGVGVGSDGRDGGLMTPSVAGQVRAVERAWRDSGCDPARLGLLEAHGTATPAGDRAEIETLGRVFGGRDDRRRVALGSVKSMIGHAMPAAGIAGLIKAALAIHHAEIPPTLHCEQPHADLARTRFVPVAERGPWEGPVRIAAVNAFGFGGINAHAILEGAPGTFRTRAPRVAARAARERFARFSARDFAGILAALDGALVPPGPCRLALFDPTPTRLDKCRRIVGRGRPWRGRDDVWFSPEGLAAAPGTLALLFPGIEAAAEPEVDDLIEAFGLAACDLAGEDALGRRGRRIVEIGRVTSAALQRCGVRADAMAGHSIGEWSGMIASEMIPRAAVDGFIATLDLDRLVVPDLAFVAAGCGLERASAAISGRPEVVITHDNCPHQVILCGPRGSIDAVVSVLGRDGVLCRVLPFQSGFHSPYFERFLAPHRGHIDRVPLQAPRVPLWSATTCAPYPQDPVEIRRLVARHMIEPVRFRELIERMYEAGTRVFVQVGVGTLTGFVDDVLGERPHLAVATHEGRRTGLQQLARAVVALHVEGVEVDTSRLALAEVDLGNRGRIAIPLGAPFVDHGRPAGLGLPVSEIRAEPTAGPDDPLLAALSASLDHLREVQHDVVAAFRSSTTPRAGRFVRTISVEAFPELLDHCFYRQPPDWPEVEDRYPVVPMTMNLELMRSAIAELEPGRRIAALEDVRAHRWLAAAPSVAIALECTRTGSDRWTVEVGEHADGVVVLADGFAAAPDLVPPPLRGARPPELAPADLYEQRWLFHGPAYRGIIGLGAIGEDGIDGTLVVGRAPGAVLDNAGQLLGYWMMVHAELDRLAFPVAIRRIAFHGPDPAPDAEVACAVRITAIDERSVEARMWLSRAGRPWVTIEGWVDRRFDTTARSWPMLKFPERNTLAIASADGWALATEQWKTTASRELIVRRYLDRRERSEFDGLPPPARRGWLLARIAAKDAVRAAQWRRGAGDLFPIEVPLAQGQRDRPRVLGEFARTQLVVAGDEEVAVALVGERSDLGVAVKTIDSSTDEARARALATAEAWSRSFALQTSVAAESLHVLDRADERVLLAPLHAPGFYPRWIATRRQGSHVIAWTPED